MNALRFVRKPLCCLSAAALMATTAPIPVAHAALVDTGTIVAQQDGAHARARVAAFMARDDVKRQMEKLGISPAEAQARVASLSDQEISQISGKLDTMPAGQGVLAIALIVVLVLLIADIIGLI